MTRESAVLTFISGLSRHVEKIADSIAAHSTAEFTLLALETVKNSQLRIAVAEAGNRPILSDLVLTGLVAEWTLLEITDAQGGFW